MKALNNISNVCLIGIGGIGMSALARYFGCSGVQVFGYDKSRTALTKELEAEGMTIFYSREIPETVLATQMDLVIYTPAVPQDHSWLQYFRNSDVECLKRSEVLQQITSSGKTIAISGSHGKTTVSSMITYLLRDGGFDCTAFLGGISTNLNSNFVSGSNGWFVVEADEFDQSFHRLNPNVAVVTAVDSDHLDIYGSMSNIEHAFRKFISNIQPEGKLLIQASTSITAAPGFEPFFTYSLENTKSDYTATDLYFEDGWQHFTLHLPDQRGEYPFRLIYPGRHNVENAVAAIAVSDFMGIDMERVQQSLGKFKGVHRRFEYIIKQDDLIFIDDYAHHPTEIEALIRSVRELYPDKKITSVFQPHLFSRTRDFAEGFAQSLDLSDEVILLPIYPAREEPIEGVTSDLISRNMKMADITEIGGADLADELVKDQPEVLLTIGAGDISELIPRIKQQLIR